MNVVFSLEGVVTIWFAATSIALFIIMGVDKYCAKIGARRVPEARLFKIALFGGAPGGWLGMQVFRHKTRHRKFALGFPALAVVQLAILWYLWNYSVELL